MDSSLADEVESCVGTWKQQRERDSVGRVFKSCWCVHVIVFDLYSQSMFPFIALYCEADLR